MESVQAAAKGIVIANPLNFATREDVKISVFS